METVTEETKAICLRHGVASRIDGKQMRRGRIVYRKLVCVHAGKPRQKEYLANKPDGESVADVEALYLMLSFARRLRVRRHRTTALSLFVYSARCMRSTRSQGGTRR